ncbi:hypothetical protein GCM10022244_44870 [Streptomyces gulbargensis]|uniref:Membrane-associated oxidoreductase n=2 Tax=Streptomyces gulbargensis TaxID=364901 RepID=A0ABP7MVX4_9ACTN
MAAAEGDGRDLLVRRRDVDRPLHLDRVSADRLELVHVDVAGILAVRSCVIEELVLDHCSADAVLVTHSRIGRLTIRNAPANCEISLADSTAEVIDVHSCGPLTVHGVRVAESVQIAAVRGGVRVKGLRTSALAVRSQATSGRRGRPGVRLEDVRAVESLLFDDLWLSSLTLQDVDTASLELRRVRLDAPLIGAGVHCRDVLRINGMVVAGEAGGLEDSDVRGLVEVRGVRRIAPAVPVQRPAPGTAPAPREGGSDEPLELTFRSSTVRRVRVSAEEGAPLVVGLDNSVVTEALSMPSGPARFRLAGDSTVQEVDLGNAVFRRAAHVNGFLERVFTRVTSNSLEAVRATLARQRRTAEADELYYRIRQREAARAPWPRRLLGNGLLGGVFGWGVRARNPARALLLGILSTALALRLAAAPPGLGPARWTDFSAAAKSLVMACALWFNVGVGAPSEVKTYAWTATAVCFTVGGLVFTTLTVGIVIRKLVR